MAGAKRRAEQRGDGWKRSVGGAAGGGTAGVGRRGSRGALGGRRASAGRWAERRRAPGARGAEGGRWKRSVGGAVGGATAGAGAGGAEGRRVEAEHRRGEGSDGGGSLSRQGVVAVAAAAWRALVKAAAMDASSRWCNQALTSATGCRPQSIEECAAAAPPGGATAFTISKSSRRPVGMRDDAINTPPR
ncbi:hypothetical protein [Oryza sativa Japonica Group]|uniref:Uncharacterized protein n=1 Tax=Oryza sativa subsp. japonica TaxID=39947 RepID=Q5QNM5_ORYSJ|nr:hypothetical protein [Oryza sativa Japonica Group]BAD73091.1 hypothetical protein [Oryza sativa Japonica Group]